VLEREGPEVLVRAAQLTGPQAALRAA
jgi:hypothetical protein